MSKTPANFKVKRLSDRSRKKYTKPGSNILQGFAGARKIDQLRLAQQALAQIRESVVITDTKLDEPGPLIVYVNQAFTRMTGYLPEEVIGRNPRLLQGPKTTRRTLDRLRSQLEKGEAFEGDDINYRKDGSEFYIDWYIEPLRDDRGRITYFVAVQRDVTERRRLEAQLLQAQRLEGIGLLASGIAHDLNNVLAPIIMGSEALRHKVLDADSSLLIDMLAQSASRGAALVKQILSFARGITGASGLVQPRHIINEIAKMAKSTFPKSTRIRIDAPPATWSVEADPTQLYQVLLNLCVNARDAISCNGTITLTAYNEVISETRKLTEGELAPGNYLALAVSDTGSGITPEVAAKIFDPFFTTKAADKGTGLGLATVALIVKNHGGAINVTTTPNEGTTFTVYLPAIADPEAGKSASAKTIARDGGGRSLLLVDDEAAITEIMKETLNSAGYVVSTAANAFEAREVLKTSPPHAVLIDMMLPDASNGELMRELHEKYPRLPVIAMSGFSGEEIRSLAPKASAILQKPFSVENLLVAVHGALSGFR